MGFIIKYNRFFSVTFGVEGSNEPLQGYRVFPDSDCRQVLDNYNLAFRSRTTGFEVFYSESPLIPIKDRVRFTFGFHIPDAGIFKKYGLAKEDDSDATVYQPGLFFDNLQADGSVITSTPASITASGSGMDERVTAADTFRIYRQTFKVYDSSDTPLPAHYELSHLYDSTLQQTVPVTAAPGADTVITTINSVDLEEDYIGQPGPYLLESNTGSPPPKNVYLSEELGRKAAKGVIDIYWETAQNTIADPDTGLQYHVTFKPK